VAPGVLAVEEAGFEFRYSGVCGFTTSFDYRSDQSTAALPPE
jgi:hypothetical protein